VIFIVGLLGLALAVMHTFMWSRDRYSGYDETVVRRRGPGDPGAPPPAY
jgi:hypothetical protein